MTNSLVTFNNQNLKLINHNNQLWLTSVDVAKALNYSDSNAITLLYSKHKAEFDEEMAQTIETIGSGNLLRKQRIFSREGAWLIGMFARTSKAAEFRKWVLKVLGAVADSANNAQTGKSVIVAEHTRALPSGKKEIVLSEKAKEEVGGIVKAVVRSELNELLTNPDKSESWEVSDHDLLYWLQNWHLTRNKADTLKFQQLTAENEELKRRLSAIKQAVN